ncbi:MAG: energy transducer TonB [Verrucomicrobiota bacterium]
MRASLAVSFAIAAACHAVLLFGFRWETSARALPMGIASAAVDLDLTAAPEGEPDTASAASAPEQAPVPAPSAPPVPEATPAVAPEPIPEPQVPPEPAPQPAPAPVALPSPSPEPPAASSTPPPVSPAAAVKRRHPKPHPAPPSHSPAEGDSVSGGMPGNAAASAGGNAGGSLEGVRVRSNPRPEYPAQARRERQEGVVLVAVEIGADGSPVDVALGRTSGFPLLDAAALRAVRRWRFEPASAAGRAAASHAEVPIRFNLVP